MRITRDLLLRLAKEKAQEKAYNDKTIIAAYLTGSLLSDEPLLGGATDIDLILVHNITPEQSREIIRLNANIHLDIVHRAQKEYEPPRELRTNPWLGYEIYDPLLLHETKHFFEFTQASSRAEFKEIRTVLQRVHKLMALSRKKWMDLQFNEASLNPEKIDRYLQALEHAANAVAELSGPPLSERRFLLELPERAQAIERIDFGSRLLTMLGADEVDGPTLNAWLPTWEQFFTFAAETTAADSRIHSERLSYYKNGLTALLASDMPLAALWPLLKTWTLSVKVLPAGQSMPWSNACRLLGLTEEPFATKLEILDHYLDDIEIIIEETAASHGLEHAEIL
ncbi:MAG: hypothetical protein L3J16_00215 [Anaerolineales bacterium]|nr:hypothetical protein [Anaerolineales bacterium]